MCSTVYTTEGIRFMKSDSDLISFLYTFSWLCDMDKIKY